MTSTYARGVTHKTALGLLVLMSLGACSSSDDTTPTTNATVVEGRTLGDFMLSMCLTGATPEEAIGRAEQLVDDNGLVAENGGPPITSLTPEIESAITNMVSGASCG